jgi:hypothetical protein
MHFVRTASRRHLKQASSLRLRPGTCNGRSSLKGLSPCSSVGQARLQSSLSSFNEAEASLFHRVTKVEDADFDLDKQLRADVKSMGTMLGKTIKHYAGEDIFDTVEKLRKSAKVRCSMYLIIFESIH